MVNCKTVFLISCQWFSCVIQFELKHERKYEEYALYLFSIDNIISVHSFMNKKSICFTGTVKE